MEFQPLEDATMLTQAQRFRRAPLACGCFGYPDRAFAGVCYLINSFATFLSPTVAAHLVPYILIPGVAELLLALWLVVFGANVERWREQEAAGERS